MLLSYFSYSVNIEKLKWCLGKLPGSNMLVLQGSVYLASFYLSGT
jgi:hypothetical protein